MQGVRDKILDSQTHTHVSLIYTIENKTNVYYSWLNI